MTSHNHLPSLGAHYSQLLGLVAPWTISDVDLDVERGTLAIHILEEKDTSFPCPECGKAAKRYDHAPVRRWRHLDTMQFTTEIIASLPRVECPDHGVKNVAVPWAEAHSRWTLLFELFAIDVLLATTNLTRAMGLLKIGWEQVHKIRKAAVSRGLANRAEEDIEHAGMDEKSFLKGHRYATLLADLRRGRVLDVVQDRTKESAKTLIEKALTPRQRESVKAVAVDMWEPFATAIRELLPDADVVHDKFHVAGYLGEAVDKVRRKEHRSFLKEGSNLLTGAKYLFLKNDLAGDEKERFRALMQDELKVGKAWVMKEAFRHFWDYVRVSAARSFFKRWYFRATHSRLAPVITVAKMLKRHLDGLLSYCIHKISNAVVEGLNSKIQQVKASARGFRNFEHYRIAILFFCGKLDMKTRAAIH